MDAREEQPLATTSIAPPSDRARTLGAALPRIASLAPRIVAAWCEAAGVAPDGPLAGAAWLAGPIASLARIRRLADLVELGSRRLAGRDVRALADRAIVELRPRSFAERGLYRDEPVSLLFGLPPAQAALAAQGGSALDVAIEARDAVTAEALAPLSSAGALRLATPAPAPARKGVAVIVPALYAKDELAFAARRLAAEITVGRAFGLPCPSVVLVATCWAQRARFVEALGRALLAAPSTHATTIEAEADGGAGGLRVEGVGHEDAIGFLEAAATRANELGATDVELAVHVVQEEDTLIAAALDRALVALEASAVGINEWPEMASLRGAVDRDVLAPVDKTIVRGPLVARRAPLYFLDARKVAERGARLAAFHAAPSLGSRLRAAP